MEGRRVKTVFKFEIVRVTIRYLVTGKVFSINPRLSWVLSLFLTVSQIMLQLTDKNREERVGGTLQFTRKTKAIQVY